MKYRGCRFDACWGHEWVSVQSKDALLPDCCDRAQISRWVGQGDAGLPGASGKESGHPLTTACSSIGRATGLHPARWEFDSSRADDPAGGGL